MESKPMTNKVEQAIENATAKRQKAKEHWANVSAEMKDVKTKLFAAEAEWLAWDALLISAQAKQAKHPLSDIIAYYGKLANEHALSSTRCIGVGFPDGAQDALIAVKNAHTEVKRFANVKDDIEVIDRIAFWSDLWANAQSLDFPDIFVRGRGYDKKDAIQHVRDKIKERLDGKGKESHEK